MHRVRFCLIAAFLLSIGSPISGVAQVLVLDSVQGGESYCNASIANVKVSRVLIYGRAEDLVQLLFSVGRTASCVHCSLLLSTKDQIREEVAVHAKPIALGHEQYSSLPPGVVIFEIPDHAQFVSSLAAVRSFFPASAPAGPPPAEPPNGNGGPPSGSSDSQLSVDAPDDCEEVGELCINSKGEASFSAGCENGISVRVSSRDGFGLALDSEAGSITLK